MSTGLYAPDGTPNVAAYTATSWALQDLGVYAIGGPNKIEDNKKICDNLDERLCEFVTTYTGQPYSVQDDWHWSFNFVEQRF